MFTGNAIRGLREALGMKSEQFAGLLGVHPSSLYRWEAKGDEAVRLDPMQLRILTVLRDELNRKPPEARTEWGEALLSALLVGGGLFALFKVLEAVFTPPRTSARGGTRTRRVRAARRPAELPLRGPR